MVWFGKTQCPSLYKPTVLGADKAIYDGLWIFKLRHATTTKCNSLKRTHIHTGVCSCLEWWSGVKQITHLKRRSHNKRDVIYTGWETAELPHRFQQFHWDFKSDSSCDVTTAVSPQWKIKPPVIDSLERTASNVIWSRVTETPHIAHIRST